MSWTLEQCLEACREEERAAVDKLTPAEQHAYKLFKEELLTDGSHDERMSFRVAIADASRLVMESRKAIMPGEREEKLNQAANVLREWL